MRAPLSWIREFVPVDAETGAIAAALDQLGLEVEAVDAPGEEIRGVKVAKALDVRKHPNADRLSLVDIDFGDGTTTVVCGAPNVAAGMVVPYAPAGATLPGGFTLERLPIRGVVSDGMLCSAKELGLGDDHSGIVELDPAAQLGDDVVLVLDMDDPVFELAITPNRPDAMSMVGVARELAAHFGLPFTVPDPEVTQGPGPAGISVEVEAPDRCPRFTLRRIAVAMGTSPGWMQQRLTKAGMRPISNVVDVTNYVLLERGQPLHAFDLDRLPGRGVVVRLAAEGERLTTLDGAERALSGEDLLVCDAERRGQSIAGIMGGGESEIHDGTTDVALESAYFTPMGISRTSKRLGLRSESSHRFERGVDPNGVLVASTRAAQLLAEVAAASVSGDAVDEYPAPVEPERIAVRTARVNAVLGVELPAGEVKTLLEPLEIATEGKGDEFVAVAPTFRPDLEREIDIVEEVGRRFGLDKIPRTLPHTTQQGGGLTPRQRDRRAVADAVVGVGASEALTIPLIAHADLERFGLPLDGIVEATNALRAEEPVLRPAILPGLLKTAGFNAGHGFGDLALFELGHVFLQPRRGDLLPDERDHLAVLFTGRVTRAPVEGDREVDVYDAVDALRALTGALELESVELVRAAAPGFAPDRSAGIVLDGTAAGHVGELAPEVVARFGVESPAVAFEVDVDLLLDATRRDRAFRAPSRYPASSIDLAFVLDEGVTVEAVERTVREAAGPLLEDVRCFDEFRADALGTGRRSLAFALRFRAPDRTLTDAEVGAARAACIDAVRDAHRAELRG
ncbi:MAG TPA: phenylalanine--tRNA ligase subunit beta [Acidimicrobiia bacterium]